MKARFYLAMAAAALLMSNCSQDEPMAQSQGGTNTLTATIEGASRSAVTDAGVFSWTAGDAFSVYNGEDFTTFTLSSGNVFTSDETITPSDVAIYPAGDHKYDGTTATVNLATSYNYGSTNAPMVAEVTNTTLAFKHVGGLMRFVVKNVPNTATEFTFTANTGITGDFEVSNDVITAATASEESNKTVTINFESSDVKDVMTFYIPVPTGTYGGYTVSVGGKSHTTETTVENTINRGTLMLMPTFTYDGNQTDLVKGEDNMVVLNGNENVSLTVADGEDVTVAIADGVEATLNLTASEGTTDGTVNISDGSVEGTESASSSAGTLNVAAEDVSTLNINTPTLTVKLTSGEYKKVEALTAANTLVIGEGVTIDELVLNGGNLKLEGDLTLEKPLEVKQDLVLDLGGHILTTEETLQEGSSSAAVIVYGGTVTVKNGIIATSGDVAHKNMGALWVRGTESATVTIENDVTLKGNNWNETAEGQTDCMATVYVSNANGYVTINGGEFYCVQQAQVEGQNQILNYKNDFTTQNITVNGGKFYGMNPAKGNGVEVSYLSENAIVAETAEGTFEVLSATNETITLGGDMTVYSPIEIKGGTFTLDLGGKTLTTAETLQEGSSSAAVIVYGGTVTVKNGIIATSGNVAHKNMGALWVRGTESATVTIENGVVLKGNNWNETAEGQTDCMATVYVSNPEGYVTINGGEFYCVQQAQVEGQNQILNYKNDFTTKNITVKGGKFYGMNPAEGNGVEVSYLEASYESTESEEGGVKVYTVSAATIKE